MATCNKCGKNIIFRTVNKDKNGDKLDKPRVVAIHTDGPCHHR
jgi:hypothetical protein